MRCLMMSDRVPSNRKHPLRGKFLDEKKIFWIFVSSLSLPQTQENLTKIRIPKSVLFVLKNCQSHDKELSERKFFRIKNLFAFFFCEKVPVVSKMIHVEYDYHISKNHRCNITVPSTINKIWCMKVVIIWE